ncbi:hypothetical protein LR48_Vigan08g159800 [Vigna angularis]|uniref:Beta-glucosidase n=1 Tax=Phaseolus angularis TaxID=3914 RepID=A0A0L9V6U3_PHAAN|nr:hypothetical protein LR48_Vigan08g159800 [Vigna angularis]
MNKDMVFSGYQFLLHVGLFTLLVNFSITITQAVPPILDVSSLNRTSFPPAFIFGTASSAYQYEGAANEGGRGPSIWDTFSHQHPDIQPFVTLFHWDLPQALEDEYGGFLSPRIINDFKDYAELCFKEFGDRVKHWITFNEPWSYSMGSEPYMSSHYQLLAHAAAVKVYKTNYQAFQKGLIGISLNCHWFIPFSNDTLDDRAAKRALDFMFGWYMQPLTRGKYPKTMHSLLGSRLPNFTEEQSRLLIGSFDFIGLNYYTTNYAAHIPHPVNSSGNTSYFQDTRVNFTRMDESNDPTLSLEEALMDTYRIDYFYRHLYYILSALKDGVKVHGYFAWSLLDNFEWSAGYTLRFGINFIDYKDNLKRHQKLSAHWFRNFLRKQ